MSTRKGVSRRARSCIPPRSTPPLPLKGHGDPPKLQCGLPPWHTPPLEGMSKPPPPIFAKAVRGVLAIGRKSRPPLSGKRCCVNDLDACVLIVVCKGGQMIMIFAHAPSTCKSKPKKDLNPNPPNNRVVHPPSPHHAPRGSTASRLGESGFEGSKP